MTIGWRALVAMSGTALAVLAAAAALFHFHGRSNVSPVPPLPAMHTICVGRLLVDVPVDMAPEGDVELYYGLGHDFQTAKLELVSGAAGKAEFEAALARRVAELTRDQDDSTPTKNMLAATRRIDEQTAFVLAHAEPVMHGYFLAEVLVLRGRSIGRLTRKVYDTEQPKDIEAKLVELARRTVAVEDASHASKGTCLGALLIQGGQDGEVFTVSLRSSQHPELTMQIMINSIIAESDGGLLQRVDSKAPLLASLELIDSAKDHGKAVRLFDIETTLAKPSSLAAPSPGQRPAASGQQDEITIERFLGDGTDTDASRTFPGNTLLPSMLISRLDVRNALLPLLVAFLSCAGAAVPASAPTGAPAKLTSAEVAKARQVALPALKVSVEEPADRVPTLKIAAAPVWSDAGASHKALLLASFTYPGAQYSYCRLVIVSADLASAQVADASEMPDCKGIARASFIDVNGDGLLDVVVGLRVQSNSADVTLEVPAVFLSEASVPGGYCYSQQASDHLRPDDLASAARARASLERERNRLGLARYVCGRH